MIFNLNVADKMNEFNLTVTGKSDYKDDNCNCGITCTISL